jgi:hypothetical protein
LAVADGSINIDGTPVAADKLTIWEAERRDPMFEFEPKPEWETVLYVIPCIWLLIAAAFQIDRSILSRLRRSKAQNALHATKKDR